MIFSELLEKLAGGEKLSENEREALVLEARRMEDLYHFFGNFVIPGSSIIVIPEARVGDALLDKNGITIPNDREAVFAIEDVAGDRTKIFFTVDAANFLHLVNRSTAAPGGVALETWLDESTTLGRNINIRQDPIQANRVLLWLEDGSQGSRFIMGLNAKLDFRTEGSGGGSTFIRMLETTNTPPAPGAGDAFHLYMKGDKLIIQYNDGGTIRYKYLDLTGTGVTWVHTTTAP